jgi:antitoxin PrlF
MAALTITSKGQVTLRRELLQHLRVRAGEQIEAFKLANGVLALQVKPQQEWGSFVGCLPPPPKALSLEEMNAVVEDAWAKA